MNAPQQLHRLGQSLWLDYIARTLLDDGSLARYLRDFAITGLTSNPTLFEQAIAHSPAYDSAIAQHAATGKTGEALFYELALEDLGRAADLLRPVYDDSSGEDGWVSLEVSPLLAHNAAGTLAAATELHARAARRNLMIKIPGTLEGLAAIEAAIFAGVPVNVTLLFSAAQYQAAAEAYLRGIERRLNAGFEPRVPSVASLFVSRWDVAANPHLPSRLHNKLGIAMATQAYRSYLALLDTPRWQKLAATGAATQRLLFASTGTKDPEAADTLYVEQLAAPNTVNTLPEKTLLAFADHGQLQYSLARPTDDADRVLADCIQAGLDLPALATRLQLEGEQAFVASWQALLAHLGEKPQALTQGRAP
jgi:transaldolase